MAVGENTYGTVAGVERLIGDIVTSRTFTTGTVPTLAQVEAELDAVAFELNAELEAYGYTIPVVNANNPSAYGLLAAANEYGAAARLLQTIPALATSFDGEEETGNTRAQMYEKMMLRTKKSFREYRIKADMTTRRLAGIKAGALTDESGNEKQPLFRRRMHEYPGSRNLVDDETDF